MEWLSEAWPFVTLMAKHKQGGKARQHAQRPGKRLGVKVSNRQKVSAGAVLIRQRGTRFHAGQNVKVGRDHTLFALKEGRVVFKKRSGQGVLEVATP